MGERVTSRLFCALALVAIAGSPAFANISPLLGVEWNTGTFYSVDTSDGSISPVYNSGVQKLIDIAYGNDGWVYGVTKPDYAHPRLYRFDITNQTYETVGTELGSDPVYEGGLAFYNGTLYGTNYINARRPYLFTVDTATGVATQRDQLMDPTLTTQVDRDINGMAFRSDGMLIGLDSAQRALLLINPADATYEVLASLSSLPLGGVGGLIIRHEGASEVGYFVTAGPNVSADAGSSELYRFNVTNGSYSRVGSFESSLDVSSAGLSGLTYPTPEPATAGLLALGALLLRRRVSR